MTSPAKLKFTIYQGATFRKRLTWTAPSGTPIDLTGCTARMQVRKEVESTTVLLSLTTENDGIALGGARATFRKGEIHARNQQEIADAHAEQEKRRVARLAAAAADGERLRQQVTEFAATCGGGEAQSPAAALQHCRDRAATLGVLYREADGQAEEFAGAAEKHADEVRTLKRVIENDRALLPPPGGVGLKPPPRPAAGSTH